MSGLLVTFCVDSTIVAMSFGCLLAKFIFSWLSDRLVIWLPGCRLVSLWSRCLVVQLAGLGSLVVWFTDCLVDCPVVCLSYKLAGCLVVWFPGCLVVVQ